MVKVGWCLHKVNGVDLSGKGFNAQFVILRKAMANLPTTEEQQSLEIVFEADGKHVPVVFAKKPLGFEFDMRAP